MNLVGTIGAFRFYHSAVALSIGITLGMATGFVLESLPILMDGHTTLELLNKWRMTDGCGFQMWIHVGIAAFLGMLVSFMSLRVIGPRFIRRAGEPRQPIIEILPSVDPDLPRPD